jgi:hypothetical protein
MGFLPRIGKPSNDEEKLNYFIFEYSVGYVIEMFERTEAKKEFDNELNLRPNNQKKEFIDTEINSLISTINNYDFIGSREFKNGYFEYINSSMGNQDKLIGHDKLINYLIHDYLKSINWNLNISQSDLNHVSLIDDLFDKCNYILFKTDLLVRHEIINEMGSMFFECEFLFQIKKNLEKIEKADFSIQTVKLNTTSEKEEFLELTEKNLGKDKERLKSLIDFLIHNGIVNKSSKKQLYYHFKIYKPKGDLHKIEWFKGISLYKCFVKYVLFGNGRYINSSKIFFINGLTEIDLVKCRDSNLKQNHVCLEDEMRKKFEQKTSE